MGISIVGTYMCVCEKGCESKYDLGYGLVVGVVVTVWIRPLGPLCRDQSEGMWKFKNRGEDRGKLIICVGVMAVSCS